MEGICGGGIIPLGEAGQAPREQQVPLGFQSALAGLLLAAEAVRDVLNAGINAGPWCVDWMSCVPSEIIPRGRRSRQTRATASVKTTILLPPIRQNTEAEEAEALPLISLRNRLFISPHDLSSKCSAAGLTQARSQWVSSPWAVRLLFLSLPLLEHTGYNPSYYGRVT